MNSVWRPNVKMTMHEALVLLIRALCPICQRILDTVILYCSAGTRCWLCGATIGHQKSIEMNTFEMLVKAELSLLSFVTKIQ